MPDAVVIDAAQSRSFTRHVVKQTLAPMRYEVSEDAWWRSAQLDRNREFEKMANEIRALGERLDPVWVRRELFDVLSRRPLEDKYATAALRLGSATMPNIAPDCETLVALSMARETDFSAGARIGILGTVQWQRRPPEVAQQALAAIETVPACVALLAQQERRPPQHRCHAIAALERRTPEVAPFITARVESGCDIEEVLGLERTSD